MGFQVLLQPQNKDVGQKLGYATIAMAVVPVVIFYLARYLFRQAAEPDNYAAGAAVLAVNIVVGAYCIMAYYEDRDEKKDNDVDAPRTGIFKQRTD